MYYPDEVIEEVRTKNDIVSVIPQYVRLTKRGGNYFGVCPFHNEKTPSFSVSPGKQMYYCFGCGAGGNVLTFVMQYRELYIHGGHAESGGAGGDYAAAGGRDGRNRSGRQIFGCVCWK